MDWPRKHIQPGVYLLVSTALVLACCLPGAAPVHAEERECRGTIGAITLDNLRVPQGASCTLRGTRAQGSITVGRNATLRASGISVNGNIQAEGAAWVEVTGGSTVGGSIQLVQGGAALIEAVRINADLYFDQNTRFITATRNRIGGNLQAFQNRAGLLISSNIIDGNLQCKENRPPPLGGNNTVQGNKEDQCANLRRFVVYMPKVIG